MSAPERRSRAVEAHRRLIRAFPGAKPELNFETPFQFLIAIVLSAQTTDVRVNSVTPALFHTYGTPERLAAADPLIVEQMIRTIGFHRTKAKAIVETARRIVHEFGGEVPVEMDKLVTLPGVGRKTANVFLGGGYGVNSGIAVDTHVARVSYRLGLTAHTDPGKVEKDLLSLIPEAEWHRVNTIWVLHGRYICIARKPKCSTCPLIDLCPKVGVTKHA
jgi:endonuclease-3